MSQIEELINKYNFNVLKLIGAGGGGYFLVKYSGNNFDYDRKIIEEANLDIQNINLDEEGCVTCEI